MAVTPNYGLTKPVVGADTDAWGTMLNGDLDIIDAEIFKKANANNPVFTGIVKAPAFVGDPSAILRPTVDGATAIQLQNAAGTAQVTVNTTTGVLTAGSGVSAQFFRGSPDSVQIRPTTDTAAAIQFQNAAGTSIINIDTVANKLTGSVLQAVVFMGGTNAVLRPEVDSATAIQFQNAAGTAFGVFNSTTKVWTFNDRGVFSDPAVNNNPVIAASKPNGGQAIIGVSSITNNAAFVRTAVSTQLWYAGAAVVDAATPSYEIYDGLGGYAAIRCYPGSTAATRQVTVGARTVIGTEVAPQGFLTVAGSSQTVDGSNATTCVARFAGTGNSAIIFDTGGVTNASGYRRGIYWTGSADNFAISRFRNDSVGPTIHDVYITSAGLVGLGTQTPDSTLHVKGLGSASATTFTPALNKLCSITITDTGAGGFGGGAVVFGSGTQSVCAIRSTYYDSSGFGQGHLSFFVRLSTATEAMTETMRLIQFGGVAFPTLPTANPGAGTKQLWCDTAAGNVVKFAV